MDFFLNEAFKEHPSPFHAMTLSVRQTPRSEAVKNGVVCPDSNKLRTAIQKTATDLRVSNLVEETVRVLASGNFDLNPKMDFHFDPGVKQVEEVLCGLEDAISICVQGQFGTSISILDILSKGECHVVTAQLAAIENFQAFIKREDYHTGKKGDDAKLRLLYCFFWHAQEKARQALLLVNMIPDGRIWQSCRRVGVSPPYFYELKNLADELVSRSGFADIPAEKRSLVDNFCHWNVDYSKKLAKMVILAYIGAAMALDDRTAAARDAEGHTRLGESISDPDKWRIFGAPPGEWAWSEPEVDQSSLHLAQRHTSRIDARLSRRAALIYDKEYGEED